MPQHTDAGRWQTMVKKIHKPNEQFKLSVHVIKLRRLFTHRNPSREKFLNPTEKHIPGPEFKRVIQTDSLKAS